MSPRKESSLIVLLDREFWRARARLLKFFSPLRWFPAMDANIRCTRMTTRAHTCTCVHMEISGDTGRRHNPVRIKIGARSAISFAPHELAAYFRTRAQLSNYCHLPSVHGDEDDRVQGATTAGGLAAALIAVNF